MLSSAGLRGAVPPGAPPHDTTRPPTPWWRWALILVTSAWASGCVLVVDADLRSKADPMDGGAEVGDADTDADAADGDAGDAGDGDALPELPEECRSCQPQGVAGLGQLPACCTEQGACGLDVGVVDETLSCEARDQPGEADSSCPRVTVESELGAIRLDGCCTPLGECGAWTTEVTSSLLGKVIDVGIGCARNSTLPEGTRPASCDPALDDANTPGHDGPAYVSCGDDRNCEARCCLNLAPLTTACGVEAPCDVVVECDGPEDCVDGGVCCNRGGEVDADRRCTPTCETERTVCHTDDDCPMGHACDVDPPVLGGLRQPSRCE